MTHRTCGRCWRVFRLRAVVAGGVFALAWPLAASDRKGTGSGAAENPVAVSGPAGASRIASTSIMGAAWQADNTPIPYARLRLRNVVTGRIQATTVANEAGQFAFHNVETGSYVVELVSEAGKILTVGHSFSVAPGETVATFVRLGTQVPWFSGFFANAAAAVASSAAAVGVTAIAPEEIRPISAGR